MQSHRFAKRFPFNTNGHLESVNIYMDDCSFFR